MRRGLRVCQGAAALLLACALPAAAAAQEESASVSGRVTLDVKGVRLADLGQTVVFLVSGAPMPPAHHERLAIHQRNARFAPDFLPIAVGQTVEMPNDDAIFHNVFSFSKPNDFDLGMYPAGEKRRVTFSHPGVVKIYCSIHESMSGTIFVSPSPWFAVASAQGDFLISGAPPGRYTLRVWNERLPETQRELTLAPGERRRLELSLDAGAP
jgi:plastocyanin